MKRLIAILLASSLAMATGCSSSSGVNTPGTDATSPTTDLSAAARVYCAPPQVRKGNRCVAPVPPPPPPAQTCWDGSIIPATQACPVQPPPPPPPVQCADGSTVPAGQSCPPPVVVQPPPPPTQTCPDGTVIDATATCPAPVPPPAPAPDMKNCPDGSSVLATADCPVVTPPPAPVPTAQWVSAPLQDGGYARVKDVPSSWSRVGPGSGRALQPGEIVAIYFNGWGYEGDNQASFSIYAFSDGAPGRALASDLQGVAPSTGTPPAPLPTDWWIPGLVTATKTCTDPRQGHEGQPGVTQGGVYRAAMLAGTHISLAAGQAGWNGSTFPVMWLVFAVGDQNAPDPLTAHTVVTGDCLVGGAPAAATSSQIMQAGERG